MCVIIIIIVKIYPFSSIVLTFHRIKMLIWCELHVRQNNKAHVIKISSKDFDFMSINALNIYLSPHIVGSILHLPMSLHI